MNHLLRCCLIIGCCATVWADDPAPTVKDREANTSSQAKPQASPSDIESPSDLLFPSPPLVDGFTPAAPLLLPDIFTRYPGVPTWHAAPLDLTKLKSHYARSYYGR